MAHVDQLDVQNHNCRPASAFTLLFSCFATSALGFGMTTSANTVWFPLHDAPHQIQFGKYGLPILTF